MTTRSRSLRLADQLSTSPYGYPLFGLFHDGGVCCHNCAKTERASIGTTTGNDGWQLVAIDTNWEDPELFCDHCGDRIESAYAEPQA